MPTALERIEIRKSEPVDRLTRKLAEARQAGHRNGAANPGSMASLSQLAAALTAAVEALETSPVPPVTGEGVDFYEEVRRFEIELIMRALRRTHGSQVKAANLLNLVPQTLNSKIKSYGINCLDE